jgi:predicted GTPase
MSGVIPVLVVVGRVNRGKSSILSTLAEDDSILVAPEPGTTRDVHHYPLRVDGRELFQLVDTPGFEDAPRALRFLKEREQSAASRREVVRSFVRHFDGSGDFQQECRLLKPILDGGAILYVVDGSHPYRTNYEAEMEILRWTGQPRIALINRTSERDHTQEWRAALDQFFSIVRTFNAHRAGFGDRLGLLQALREVDETWRPRFDEAIQALNQDWERRRRQSARIVAEMVATATLHTRSLVLENEEDLRTRKKEVEERFHDDLRKMEEEGRRKIEALYLHRALVRMEAPMPQPILDEDLFSEKTWETLGLSLPQLAGLGVLTGAGTGGVLDVLTGGTLFGAGLLVGSVVGGGAALYFGTSRFERAGDLLTYFRGGRRLLIGPHRNPNFPWVLLDRALLHYVSVRDRAHGRRDPLQLATLPSRGGGEAAGFAANLPEETRRKIARLFSALRSRGGRERREELQSQLGATLEEVLRAIQAETLPLRASGEPLR